MEIAKKGTEGNIIMGKAPSAGVVHAYFASCILGNTALYAILPEKWRTVWYSLLIGLESAVVMHNINVGIKF